MAMSQSDVFYLIVRPVLADSLGLTKQEESDIWLPCSLEKDLGATESEDLGDIAWRLRRKFLELKLNIHVRAEELAGPRKTVADVLILICHKLDEAEVPASEIVTLVKPV